MPAVHPRVQLRAALLALVAVAAAAAPARGQDDAARDLAARYAPVVVGAQPGQSVRPRRRGLSSRPGGDGPRRRGHPPARRRRGARDGGPRHRRHRRPRPETSLDLPGNPRRPGCGCEQDFDRLGAARPDTAYAHVATDPSAPGRLALQYWLFWYFDDYVNTHEGDWEFVQIVWDVPTVEEALRTAPVETGYSQHSGGERADWDGDKLERDGDHPVVYAAAGSYANFYTADLFLGRNADQGFGCDDARAPGTRLPTRARLLPSGAVDPEGPDAWLLFEGRWGEFQPPPYDAPPGPLTKEEWREPIAWQESLRDGSFAVPTGTTLGPTATGAFCSVVRIGGAVYTAVTSPVVLLLIVVALVSTAGVAARSTAWSPRVPHPLRRARSAGQIITSAAEVFRRRRWTMVAVGVLFLPAALLELALHQLVFGLTPLGDLADVAGRQSLVSVALALFVAGAGHVLAATLVVGGVAMVLDAAERGDPTGIRDAYAMLSRRAGRLLRTALRAGAIALGLAVTVVGIPWAIALLGRWAVAVQVTAIEGSGPGEALARSRVLVRGRWWRTAAIAATVNVIGAVSGPVVGIALLFLSDLPLATVNAVSSAVFVCVMPLAGAALAFLYGDLVARRPGPTPPPSAAP